MKPNNIKEIVESLKMKPLNLQAKDDPSLTVVRDGLRLSYYPHLNNGQGIFVFDGMGRNVGIVHYVNENPYKVEKVLILLAHYGFNAEGLEQVQPEFTRYTVDGKAA